MTRPTNATTQPVDAVVVLPAAAQRIADTQDALTAQEMEASTNARAVAVQMGYDGSLTVGAIEDEIRFYQRRTVEAILETGKRLMILKELTPHGQFQQRVEMLGFHVKTAQRFMTAAAKTAKSDKLSLLSTQIKSASAFLELVTHDDDTLESLNDMDDIDRMSATELRNTLRQAKEDNKFIADKRDKESARADNAEKALRAGGPKARSLEERVAEFGSDVNKAQDTTMESLLNLDQQVKALDAWWLDYMAQQPDFMPGEGMPMPVEVIALAQKLYTNVQSIAASVGGLQNLVWNTFGPDIEAAGSYVMRTTGAANEAEAA